MREYWIVIRRRKRLLLGCLVACLALAVALNELMTPVYRSSARVQIEPEANRSVLTGMPTGASQPQANNEALFNTAEVATSRTLLAQVVRSLERQGVSVGGTRWGRNPFSPPVQAATTQAAGGRAASGNFAPAPPQDLERKVDWLLAHLTVEPVRDTRLLRISVEDSDPGVAAKITNGVAENLVNYQQLERSDVDSTLASYLRMRAAEVKTHIDDLEREPNDARQSNLFSLDGKVRQVSETITQQNDSYTKTRLQRLAVSSQLTQIRAMVRNGDVDPGTIPIHTETLDALRRDLLASTRALAKARELYGEMHPKLVALQSENEAIRRNIRQEINNAIGGLEDEHSILTGREQSLQREIAQAEENLRSLNSRAEKFRSVEDAAKSSRDLYNLLIARVREAEITGQGRRPPISIVEPASVDSEPVRPRKVVNLAIGLLLGILSGTGSSFLLESARRTIRTPQDVDHHLQLPVLGMIPKDVVP